MELLKTPPQNIEKSAEIWGEKKSLKDREEMKAWRKDCEPKRFVS